MAAKRIKEVVANNKINEGECKTRVIEVKEADPNMRFNFTEKRKKDLDGNKAVTSSEKSIVSAQEETQQKSENTTDSSNAHSPVSNKVKNQNDKNDKIQIITIVKEANVAQATEIEDVAEETDIKKEFLTSCVSIDDLVLESVEENCNLRDTQQKNPYSQPTDAILTRTRGREISKKRRDCTPEELIDDEDEMEKVERLKRFNERAQKVYERRRRQTQVELNRLRKEDRYVRRKLKQSKSKVLQEPEPREATCDNNSRRDSSGTKNSVSRIETNRIEDMENSISENAMSAKKVEVAVTRNTKTDTKEINTNGVEIVCTRKNVSNENIQEIDENTKENSENKKRNWWKRQQRRWKSWRKPHNNISSSEERSRKKGIFKSFHFCHKAISHEELQAPGKQKQNKKNYFTRFMNFFGNKKKKKGKNDCESEQSSSSAMEYVVQESFAGIEKKTSENSSYICESPSTSSIDSLLSTTSITKINARSTTYETEPTYTASAPSTSQKAKCQTGRHKEPKTLYVEKKRTRTDMCRSPTTNRIERKRSSYVSFNTQLEEFHSANKAKNTSRYASFATGLLNDSDHHTANGRNSISTNNLKWGNQVMVKSNFSRKKVGLGSYLYRQPKQGRSWSRYFTDNDDNLQGPLQSNATRQQTDWATGSRVSVRMDDYSLNGFSRAGGNCRLWKRGIHNTMNSGYKRIQNVKAEYAGWKDTIDSCDEDTKYTMALRDTKQQNTMSYSETEWVNATCNMKDQCTMASRHKHQNKMVSAHTETQNLPRYTVKQRTMALGYESSMDSGSSKESVSLGKGQPDTHSSLDGYSLTNTDSSNNDGKKAKQNLEEPLRDETRWSYETFMLEDKKDKESEEKSNEKSETVTRKSSNICIRNPLSLFDVVEGYDEDIEQQMLEIVNKKFDPKKSTSVKNKQVHRYKQRLAYSRFDAMRLLKDREGGASFEVNMNTPPRPPTPVAMAIPWTIVERRMARERKKKMSTLEVVREEGKKSLLKESGSMLKQQKETSQTGRRVSFKDHIQIKIMDSCKKTDTDNHILNKDENAEMVDFENEVLKERVGLEKMQECVEMYAQVTAGINVKEDGYKITSNPIAESSTHTSYNLESDYLVSQEACKQVEVDYNNSEILESQTVQLFVSRQKLRLQTQKALEQYAAMKEYKRKQANEARRSFLKDNASTCSRMTNSRYKAQQTKGAMRYRDTVISDKFNVTNTDNVADMNETHNNNNSV